MADKREICNLLTKARRQTKDGIHLFVDIGLELTALKSKSNNGELSDAEIKEATELANIQADEERNFAEIDRIMNKVCSTGA